MAAAGPRRAPAPGSGPPGSGRRRKRARDGGSQRLVRTILLGAVAAVFAIAWLARELGLDADELIGYLGASLVLVGLVVVLGILAGGLLWLVRRARTRQDSER